MRATLAAFSWVRGTSAARSAKGANTVRVESSGKATPKRAGLNLAESMA